MMTIARTIATIAATLAVAAPAKSDPGCRTRKCLARVMHRECSQRHPRACVLHVIYHQRITGWRRAWMLRVPGCESTWNPFAVSPGGHRGLYQFAPGTWAGTPYGRRSIFSAFWQPFAAAWMLRQGRVREWACT
jgi:hypothetical protein